jgi:hypothetical protein
MKLFKTLLIAVLIIIAVPLITALFIPADYEVKRDITIDRPKDQIFTYIKYLKNQDQYSKWAQMDPDMTKSYSGIDGTVGFVSAWNSSNDDVGSGEQKIIKIAEGDRIDYEILFHEPFDSKAFIYMTTEAKTPTQTKVSWAFTGTTPYPWNVMSLFMDFEQLIGGDLEEGLGNLKEIAEKDFK